MRVFGEKDVRRHMRGLPEELQGHGDGAMFMLCEQQKFQNLSNRWLMKRLRLYTNGVGTPEWEEVFGGLWDKYERERRNGAG